MGVHTSLGSNDIVLVVKRTANCDDAVLEDCGGVTKDKVDGAGDDAASVVL